MTILQVFTANREFVGEVDEYRAEDRVLKLQNTCIIFRIQAPGNSLTIKAIPLVKDDDYRTGDVALHAGAGVLVMPLSEEGPTCKLYRQAISGILQPKMSIVRPN